MTSRRSWRSDLSQALSALGKPSGEARVALVGVGNALRSDDCIGVHIARALASAFAERGDMLVLDAGTAPENMTGVLRNFAPDLVVFIDAADLGEREGVIRWLDWRETVGLSSSTHTLPLHVVSEFLTRELGCKVSLVGIQVPENGFQVGDRDEWVALIADVVDGMVNIFLR